MLVYDITNAKTFDNISKWIRYIEENANEDVEKMILANKVLSPQTNTIPSWSY